MNYGRMVGMEDLTLLVLAAGMGSRYGGLKQIESVGPGGEILLDYAVYDAMQAGIRKVVFVIRREMELVFEGLVRSRYGSAVEVELVFQCLEDLPGDFSPPTGREKPWGTGHAVWAARKRISGKFLVINADDFYGRSAFFKMVKGLNIVEDGGLVAGYPLGETLSPSGPVSRGVCQVGEDGLLLDIKEFTRIKRVGERIFDEVEGKIFHGDELVSMNCWGFASEIFSLLEMRFSEFLQKRVEDVKAEFYLPGAVCDLVQARRLSVRVLPAESEWFGVTYREDLEGVRSRLREMHTGEIYPKRLFPA